MMMDQSIGVTLLDFDEKVDGATEVFSFYPVEKSLEAHFYPVGKAKNTGE